MVRRQFQWRLEMMAGNESDNGDVDDEEEEKDKDRSRAFEQGSSSLRTD